MMPTPKLQWFFPMGIPKAAVGTMPTVGRNEPLFETEFSNDPV
jgi:hypothetical protein